MSGLRYTRYSDSALLLYSQYVVLTDLVCYQISYVPVYKLVRFYEPSSEDQYETTRATLTVFSG